MLFQLVPADAHYLRAGKQVGIAGIAAGNPNYVAMVLGEFAGAQSNCFCEEDWFGLEESI